MYYNSLQEIVHSADEEEEYSPLTCDMCSQTFNRPSDWVRHIEFTHADMTENRRKKRKVRINKILVNILYIKLKIIIMYVFFRAT